MESQARFESLIQNLRQQYDLKAETSVLDEAISGLDDGMKWVLQKYQRADSPELMIGQHPGSMAGVNGFTETETGEKLIGLQVDELRKLEGANLLYEDYGDDIPVKPSLTVRQYYESFGVEETLHWLQDKGVEGLANLPPHEQRILPGGLPYMLQTYEFEGLVVRGEYFKQKYGNNPLQELEDFIRSKQT